MAQLRFRTLEKVQSRQKNESIFSIKKKFGLFWRTAFLIRSDDENAISQYFQESQICNWKSEEDRWRDGREGRSRSKDLVDELGITHFTHWFQPLKEATREKHEAFYDPQKGLKTWTIWVETARTWCLFLSECRY